MSTNKQHWFSIIATSVAAFFGVAIPFVTLSLSYGDRFWVPNREFLEFRTEVRGEFQEVKFEIRDLHKMRMDTTSGSRQTANRR
jgi:hypothetical protein